MSFNLKALGEAQYNASMSTVTVPIPEGEYVMMVGDWKDDWMREQTANTGRNAGGTFVSVDVPVEIIDDALRIKLGRDKLLSRYRFILDIDANGQLDFSEGKNVRLGKLREVLDQNTPGVPWSMQQLASKGPFKGWIKQTSDKTDPSIKYSEVSRVAKAS